jgi:hypothetical protein
VAQQSADLLDPLFPADFRPALVPRQVQDQIAGQPGQIPQPGIRPAQIRNRPRLPSRKQEDRPGLSVADGLTDQFFRLVADTERLVDDGSLERSPDALGVDNALRKERH